MRTINIKLIGSILLFTVGILLFSLSIQKYQVLTSSQAAIGIPQCIRPSGASTPSNFPCGSCSIFDSKPSGSTVTVTFACEILCNNSGNSTSLLGCPANTIPHNITDTSWFWCSGAGGAACTENSPDLRKKGSFTGGGPWIISKQGTTNFAATFLIDGFQNCGRIQTDVNMTQIAGHVEDLKTSCDTTQPTHTKTPTLKVPTSTPSSEEPTLTPTDEEPTLTPTDTFPTNVASSNTPIPPTVTRTPTPTKTPVPPTATRTPTPTFTPTPTRTPTPIPTATLNPTLTPTGTLTPSPTGTPVLATATPGGPTLTPTGVSGVTGTVTATIVPTTGSNIAQVPQNTLAPIIYEVTVTPVRNLTVNRQAPGITPWVLLAIPLIMVLVGLFL